MQLYPTAANRLVGLHPDVRRIVTSLRDATHSAHIENIDHAGPVSAAKTFSLAYSDLLT